MTHTLNVYLCLCTSVIYVPSLYTPDYYRDFAEELFANLNVNMPCPPFETESLLQEAVC